MNRQREIPSASSGDRGQGLLVERARAHFVDFGLGPYEEILAVQDATRQARQAGSIPDTWLFGEHPAVITQGVRGEAKDIPGAARPGFDLPVIRIDRGGMTTLHCPGQMILYPIVKLGGGSLAAGRMARALLQSLRSWLLSVHGIEAEIPPGRPGLFVDDRKLMSVGISVRKGVSMHGIAMNLSNDLTLWDHIIACGEAGTRPLSLSEILGRTLTPESERDSIRSWLQSDWGYAEVINRPMPTGAAGTLREGAI